MYSYCMFIIAFSLRLLFCPLISHLPFNRLAFCCPYFLFLCNSYWFPSSVLYSIYFTRNPATVCKTDLHCRHNLQLAAAAYTFVAVRNFMCRNSVPIHLFLFSNYTLSCIVHTTIYRCFLFHFKLTWFIQCKFSEIFP